MIVIYHSADLDGVCSAAICTKKYPEATLIGYDYWQELPWDQLPPNQDIIMVDVSVNMPEMVNLAVHSNSLTWIDHHASAIKEFEQSLIDYPHWVEDHRFTSVLEIGKAGCELAWEYLFPNEPMPKAVKLLGTYDVFRQDNAEYWNWSVLPFQWGMRLITRTKVEDFDPFLLMDNEVAEDRIQDYIDTIMEQGSTVLQYQQQQDEAAMRGAFEVEFQGLRAIACNIKGVGSLAFNSVYDPEKHDLMVAFGFGHGKWAFSLRTTHEHVDVSVIAKQFGGGGHKAAAGFAVLELTEVLTLPKPS